MSKKIGFFSNINRGDTVPQTVTVFDVSASLSNTASPLVPDTITFDIDSTLTPTPDTVPVYWSTSGGNVSVADFTDGEISGSVKLDAQGNATVVRQITLTETGASGNVVFTFKTGDPVIGNVIHTQTVDLTSSRYATKTRYVGDGVQYADVFTQDYHLLYNNTFANTNNQGELLYSDQAVRLELVPGDKLEITSIQTPDSNTAVTDVEVLQVGISGSSGFLGTTNEANTLIGSSGGGAGGHVVHATNVSLTANTYIVVDRIYERTLTAYGKTETGTGAEFTVFDRVNGMGMIDTGVMQVYNTAQAANASATVGEFAIILNTTNYPYQNTVKRYDGAAWQTPSIGAQQTAAKNALANALVVSRSWSPDISTAGTDDIHGAGVNYYGARIVPPEGGGGGDGANTTVTTGIASISENVLQTAYIAGNSAVTASINDGAGGAGQAGNGGDPTGSAGGAGGAGFVSDIRGFGNVQYGAGGAGANATVTGTQYVASNYRQWNDSSEQFETVTAYPPGTGQQGYGDTITRITPDEYGFTSGGGITNQGRIYLKFTDFRRFLTL